MKQITIPVKKQYLRVLPDPFGKHDACHALVDINALPANLPLDINPRNQNTESRVSRNIEHSILNNPENFHLLNRGMTLTVSKMRYDNQKEELQLTLDDERHGVIDGGHTYAMILKNREGTKAFVKLEVLQNIRRGGLMVELVRARNTSAQVKDQSIANLEGRFEWIKAALINEPYGDAIAWRENEDGDEKPLDVREIIAFLTMFHPDYKESENPPTLSYTSKGRCLEKFSSDDEAIQRGYQNLRNVLPGILKMYDYVHKCFEPMYRDIGGLSAMNDDKERKGVKLGKVVEVKHIKDGFPLYYLGETAEYRFPDGWIYPVLASLRALVLYKGVYKWRTDPETFFDKYGKKLVQATLEASRALGRNPNAVGKNAGHWAALHEKVINACLRMTGGNEESEFVV